MRIVCISDLHFGCPSTGKEFMPILPSGDVLIVAGDLTMSGTNKQLREAARWLNQQNYGMKLVVPGNHDWYFVQYTKNQWNKIFDTNTHVLIGTPAKYFDVNFFGFPWTPKFFDWAFMLSPEEMWEYCEKIPPGADVLISHGPPFGILDRNVYGENCGCNPLEWHIKNRLKPKYNVFGHIHEGYGKTTLGETTYINCSLCSEHYSIKNDPIVIDFEK